MYLGIELGSTRIKAVLIDGTYAPVASGAHDWENKLTDGYWTYSLEDVWAGVRDAYAALAADYRAKTGKPLTRVDALGVSGMMHGYLAFDQDGSLLVPFRTWRNTTTGQAAAALTERFGFNIPQRWSVAHLYQAILNREPHVPRIAFITTLAGYLHWKLTGKKTAGLGEASGIFPIDSATGDYDKTMLAAFRDMTGLHLPDLLPAPLSAGANAGTLTPEGAKRLDPSGALQAGAVLCPPEGDAGTGMVATNCCAPRTGNVSAGTSIFAMLVLEKPLGGIYKEVGVMATPAGRPVATVHAATCTTDLDAWVKLLGEAAGLMGASFTKAELYDALYAKALEGETDGGGLLHYPCHAGEPVIGLDSGRPLFTRLPDSRMELANFMRVQLYAAMAVLKCGMDILTGRENIRLDVLLGHGGLFKTEGVGQRLMASALNVPVAVRETAAEGGAWGIALLAAYTAQGGPTLEGFLDTVFADSQCLRAEPDAKDAEGFAAYMRRYRAGLDIERAAADILCGNGAK